MQGEVWREVQEKSVRHHALSKTSAMHDVYETHRGRLDEFAGAVRPRDGQVGALVAVGARFVVLDHVSDPEAWAVLHGPLVQGYALDALEIDLALAAPSVTDAIDFVTLLTRAPKTEASTPGLGRGLRFEFGELAGTGLTHEGEVVSLTAFAA